MDRSKVYTNVCVRYTNTIAYNQNTYWEISVVRNAVQITCNRDEIRESLDR